MPRKKKTKDKTATKAHVERYVYVIVIRGAGYVFEERLRKSPALALVGGKIHEDEDIKKCIARVFYEKAGCALTIHRRLGSFDSLGRGRSPKISTVFVCSALGRFREEKTDSRIAVFSSKAVRERKNEFALGHYNMFENFLKQGGVLLE